MRSVSTTAWPHEEQKLAPAAECRRRRSAFFPKQILSQTSMAPSQAHDEKLEERTPARTHRIENKGQDASRTG